MKNLKVMLLAFVISILMTAYVGAKDIMTFNHDELLSEYERSDDVYQKYVNEKLPYRIMYKDYATGEVTYEYFNCDASEYENENVVNIKSKKKKSSNKKNSGNNYNNNEIRGLNNNNTIDYNQAIIDQNDEEKNVGWVEFNGAWYYQDENGENKKGWQYIGDKWYYLDPETFIMVTGLKEINGKKYYFEVDGHMFRGGTVIFIDGKFYYVNENGEVGEGKTITWENNGINNSSSSYSSDLPEVHYIYGASSINSVLRECIKYHDSAIAGNRMDVILLKGKVEQLESLVNVARSRTLGEMVGTGKGISSDLEREFKLLNTIIAGLKGYVLKNLY